MESSTLPDGYAHLTPQFMERLQALFHALDPLGKWRSTYPLLLQRCLDGLERFYAKLDSYLDAGLQAPVTDALFLAFEAHGLTLRKSGDALYFDHPLEVTSYLATYRLDAPTLAAALLHDVAEDTLVTIPRIVELFGPEVGKLVDGVTRLRVAGREVTSQIQREAIRIETINKLFRFMVEDVRVVLVKLSDRLHNMQTIRGLPLAKQREKAYEVLEVYAPLAYRLGMWDVKSDLEALALEVLEPQVCIELKARMQERSLQQADRLDRICRSLSDQLGQAGVPAAVEESPERIYSVYREHYRNGHLDSRLSDVIRLAVLAENREDCYRALGVVHGLWMPVHGTFDDYVAYPRENLYRALHTTVFGPGGPLKVRIRTHEMHQIAHDGILTRWSTSLPDQWGQIEEQVQRLMQRLRVVTAIANREDRLQAFREALTDQIRVYTPKGRVVELPAGSTPLDFAYQIHTVLGDEAISARINNVPQPLNTPLRNGDKVEIVRAEGTKPFREWLDEDLGFVRTAYARNKIGRAFRRIEGAEAASTGREALQREMQLMGLPSYDLEQVAQELGYPGAESLLVALARAELMPYVVAHRVMAAEWGAMMSDQPDGVVLSRRGPVVVRGVAGLVTKLCGSCAPVPGDPILGNLLRGGQVTVHRMDCPFISRAGLEAGRLNLVDVDWIEKARTVRPVHICMAAVDRPGLVHDLTLILDKEQVNIRQLYGAGDTGTHLGVLAVTVELTDLRQLTRILHRLAQLPNLEVVQRVAEFPHGREALLAWAEENMAES